MADVLRERVAELIQQHGSLRAAARVLGVNAGYLHRLGSGEKDEPGELLLRRMGLRRTVTYHRNAGVTVLRQQSGSQEDGYPDWRVESIRS